MTVFGADAVGRPGGAAETGRGLRVRTGPEHGMIGVMTILLAAALAVVLVLMVLLNRYWETWLQIAGLLACVLLMLWMQDHGYIP